MYILCLYNCIKYIYKISHRSYKSELLLTIIILYDKQKYSFLTCKNYCT